MLSLIDKKPETEETVINQKPAGKQKKQKATRKTSFSYEEIQEKFSRIFNALAFFWKVDKVYIPEDFQEEAKDTVRLAEKYPPIASVLTFLDPLFLILGLFSKFRELGEKVRARKKKEEAYELRDQEIAGDQPWPESPFQNRGSI